MKATFDFLNKYKSWLIIGVLVIIILLQRSCGPTCPEAKIETIIKHDTIEKIVYKDRPVPYQVIVPDKINTIIDSTKCQLLYRLFNSKNIYLDTLLNDSTALISVRDTVYQNELQHRKLYFTNRRPTVIQNITTIIKGDTIKKRNKVFVGATLGGWSDKITMGGSLMLITKKDHGYSATFDPFYKCVYGTIYWKIKLSKK